MLTADDAFILILNDRAQLLTARKANDKNIPLFDPPDPADPRLVKRQGSKLARRVHTATTPGGAV